MSLPAGFSLTDFAEHMNRSDAFAENSYEAEMHVNSAIEIVESVCGPLSPRTVTVDQAVAVRGAWLSPYWPVLSVSAVNYYDATEVAGVVVDSSGAVRFGTYLGGTYTVTLEVGRDPIPASLLLATYIIASHLWDTQRGRSARPGIMGDDAAVVTPMGYAIPSRAAQLMAPHRSVMVH